MRDKEIRQEQTESILCRSCNRRLASNEKRRCDICISSDKKRSLSKLNNYLLFGTCTYCSKNKAVNGLRSCESCLEKNKIKTKKKHIKLKIEIMDQYGNSKCECCGESNLYFLTIDHKYNDGTIHKKSINRSRKGFYLYLKKNGFPEKDRLRVLCYNCNFGREREKGKICPHKQTSFFKDRDGI